MKKLNLETVLELFTQNGYTIVSEYKNTTTPVICEKCDYRYKISYHNLKSGKKPSLWGFSNLDNLDYNVNQIILKKQLKIQYLGYEIVTHKNKKRILLHLKCSCGKLFDKILEDAIYNKYLLCNDCVRYKRGLNKRIGKTAVCYLQSIGYKVFFPDLIYKNNDYIEVEDKYGFRGFVTYSHIKRHKKMSYFDIRVNKKYYIYNVNLWAKLNNIDVICLGFCDIDKYTRQALKFQCSCGNIFITSISSFQNGKIRCEECTKSISRYEYLFKTYLDQQNICYIYQYSYNQCRDILPLPFDFYLPNYDCLIEIDGEGHYRPCHFNQIGYEKALYTFNITKKHDKIKDTFCDENNIKLLRIPYTCFINNTYSEFFQNFIRELTNSN